MPSIQTKYNLKSSLTLLYGEENGEFEKNFMFSSMEECKGVIFSFCLARRRNEKRCDVYFTNLLLYIKLIMIIFWENLKKTCGFTVLQKDRSSFVYLFVCFYFLFLNYVVSLVCKKRENPLTKPLTVLIYGVKMIIFL